MSDLPPDPAPPTATVEPHGLPVAPAGTAAWLSSRAGLLWRLLLATLTLLAVLAVVAMAVAWRANRRVGDLEQELVRRQQDSAGQANEARLIAREAQESVRDASAKVALLEARVAEISAQRTQFEDLIQSLSRSRDENLLGDVEASIRVAVQQTVITGGAEPLVMALKQADERLARYSLPRLEDVRRAIGRDLDRVKAVSLTDVPSLAIKLDEAIRLVDDLPLLAGADARHEPLPGFATTREAGSVGAASGPPAAGSGGALASTWAGAAALASWGAAADAWWRSATGAIWSEARSLVRVTRVDHPDAMLLAPEQAFFVRENLKLRLLNARLALLSRQFDSAQSDLTVAVAVLRRYFERGSKRTIVASELIAQVSAQARQVNVPRPDETLAALAAAGAGR